MENKMTEERTYAEPGIAHYYCPELYKLMGNRHSSNIDHEELQTLDGGGHTIWTFHWDAGAWHLDHPNNGGIPKCKKCGQTLIHVAGDNAHDESLLAKAEDK